MTRADAEQTIRATTRTCRGPIEPEAARVRDALLEDGRVDEAADEDKAGRARGCGADFNDIVCAGPLDGSTCTYTCPRCGVTGEYIAPCFTLGPS
jgi:hypothetical protein